MAPYHQGYHIMGNIVTVIWKTSTPSSEGTRKSCSTWAWLAGCSHISTQILCLSKYCISNFKHHSLRFSFISGLILIIHLLHSWPGTEYISDLLSSITTCEQCDPVLGSHLICKDYGLVHAQIFSSFISKKKKIPDHAKAKGSDETLIFTLLLCWPSMSSEYTLIGLGRLVKMAHWETVEFQ